MRIVLIALSASLLAMPSASAQNPSTAASPKIDYGKDVKPILMSRCFSCHGPKQVQSGLRLDQGADMPGNALEGEAVRGATDPELHTLIDAIARRDLAAVKRMLTSNGDFARATDSAGSTALMHAASSSTTAVMEAVIDAGADVNASNTRLDHGADANAMAAGETPLSLAAKRGETGVTTLLRRVTATRTSKVRQ